MKVVLLNDIPGVGNRYDIKEVADGYACNFLLPKKLAEVATPQGLAKVGKMKKEQEIKQKLTEEKIKASLEKLKDFVLKIKEKANEVGHLFSGIDKKKISALLTENSIELPEESIILKEPIKKIGEFEIEIKTQDKKAKLKLFIEPLQIS